MGDKQEKAMYQQLDIARQFTNIQTGKTSYSLLEVAQDSRVLSVDLSYICHPWEYLTKTKAGHSLLREVAIKSPTVPEELDRLSANGGSPEETATALETAIEAAWDSQKHHLIWHSSGNDSRILSGILCKLVNKNGINWLGKTLLICHPPEHICCEAYLESLPEKYLASLLYVPNRYQETDYWEELTSFDTIAQVTNGIWLPSAFNYRLWKSLHTNIVRQPVQVFSMAFCNESMDTIWTDTYDNFVLGILNNVIYSFLGISFTYIKMNAELITPAVSHDVIRASAKAKGISGLRQKVLQAVGQDLDRTPRYSGQANTPLDPYRKLSKNTIRTCQATYNASWIGRRLRLECIDTFTQSKWWNAYSAAALCEYLIKHGVTLKEV